jgi:hypothetical protein
MPFMPQGPLCAAGPHDQADRTTGDHAIQVGASRWGAVDEISRALVAVIPGMKASYSSWRLCRAA